MKIIRFEVNGRTASLIDSKHEAAIKEAFAFYSPKARYTPAHKLWLQQKSLGVPEEDRQGWDGKQHMMLHGEVPVGLLFGANKELEKAGFKVEITEWTNRPRVTKQLGFLEKNLNYDYQNKAVNAMRNCIADGGGLVLAATGSGKTKVAAQFFSWLDCDCLFVVDQIDLLYQSQKEIQNWLSSEGYDTKVGVVGNGKFEPERITIATIQTLHKQKKSLAFRQWTAKIQIVLIDEIHVQMSRRNFDVLEKIKPQAVIGLTATIQLKQKPVRYKCHAICGPLIFEFPMTYGVEAGVLSQGVVVQAPVYQNETPIPNIQVKRYGRWITKPAVDDYTHHVVNNDNLHNFTVALVKKCRKEDLATVVLVDRIKHLTKLKNRLEKYDPKIFYGAVKVSTRKKQLKTFDSGKDNLIIANRVFTKGINLKRIDVVIDTAQRSSRNDCIQKFGRAIRLHSEKAGVYYIDLYTLDKMEKAAKNRKGAFKKNKIPFTQLPILATTPELVLQEADHMLTEVLKKHKLKSDQGKLFT